MAKLTPENPETTPAEPAEATAPEPVDTVVEPDPVVEPVETVPAEGAAVEPVEADGGDTPSVETPAAASPSERVVYVQTPAPPRKRGNRVVGVLLTLVGVIVFAVAFIAVAALVISIAQPANVTVILGSFVQSWNFWVPLLVFLVASVLAALLVNRGGWWAHVLASLVVALVVYFGQIGVFLLGAMLPFGPEPKGFVGWATDPFVIASAVVAREVSIWIGLGIAARGRRVKSRNTEARAAYDKELAEKRAEHERQAAAAV